MAVIMRATRLLSILMLLQAKGRLTAEELANRLEVSVRTMYRDLDTLQRAGVPLRADVGPAGGYQLVAGYTTRLTGLTTAEADALFLTGMPGPASELGLGAAVAAARLKLHAALPPELRDRAVRILERFHLDPGAWYRESDRPPLLAAVAGAVWDARRIQVRYRRWKAPSEVTRTLDPHGVVLKAGVWYLVARIGEDMRTYRVSQITRLTVLDEHFVRHEGFDLAKYWDAYLIEFSARMHTADATIRLSRDGRARIRELMDVAVATAVETTASTPDPGGWTTAVVPIESLEHARAEFLKFGPELEVVQPQELRSLLKGSATALADLYRSRRSKSPVHPTPAATSARARPPAQA
jgi:predicted DNA-binding transcriptional regulator YafY